MKLLAHKPIQYNGYTYKDGDEFEATDNSYIHALISHSMISVISEEKPKRQYQSRDMAAEEKPKRKYQRRDMVADEGNA